MYDPSKNFWNYQKIVAFLDKKDKEKLSKKLLKAWPTIRA